MARELSRRAFLVGVPYVVSAFRRTHVDAAAIRVGYAAITWQGDDDRAIREIAEVGYKGIQLRNTAVTRFGWNPRALRDLLARLDLTFAVLSSGNLRTDPSVEQDELDLHVRHARFVREAGGLFIQVIDQKPRDRALTTADYTRLGTLMTELGKRTADAGVPLVYHHHMNSIGEKPDAIDAVLDAADPRHVAVLFDIAHYQQGGGDPVAAIRRYRDRIRVVHLKDVRRITASPGYQWVELGRGLVDVKGCVEALKEISFNGWAIVELDRVTEAGGSEKASALANRKYVEQQLGLTL